MLYGIVSYVLLIITVSLVCILLFNTYFKANLYNIFFYNYVTTFLLSLSLYFSFIVLGSNYLIYESVSSISLYKGCWDIVGVTNSVILKNIGFNYFIIYTYPFIFIFLFITLLSLIYCLSYNYTESFNFMLYVILILVVGFFLFQTESLLIFFFFYEMLLVPSFFILYKFAKTKRCIEAAYLMFFWTQFGALFLIFAFIYIYIFTNSLTFFSISLVSFSKLEVSILFYCLLIGFGVKLPIWPFYGWLPKAHVEASTNFSIFLSGVLVKFAFFGLFKCLLLLHFEPATLYVLPFLILGIIDSGFKLFYQIDLKKLVAYSTVVEMHWLTICLLSGQTGFYLTTFCMLISHAFLSTNSFFLVDAINRRFKTRLINEISGVNFLTPKLFLVALANLLVFLGFPGTIFFIAEFLFFMFFFELFPIVAPFIMFILYFFVPTFFFRSWMNVLFGLTKNIANTIPADLSSKEFLLYGSLVFIMFWLGNTWQVFLL